MTTVMSTAIGLFYHGIDMPTADALTNGYDKLLEIFGDLGLESTYFSAQDAMMEGGYKKFGGAFHKRVLAGHAEGYQTLAIAANPKGSKSPGYDSFAEAGFGFSPEGEQVYVNLVVREPYLYCGSKTCDDIIRKLADLWRWDYGFAFERDAATSPVAYLLGGASNLQSIEDARRGQLWYSCYQPEDRQNRVRDIFPYNLIGPAHLARRLPDGRDLQAFIESDPDSKLQQLSDAIWSWKVQADRTEAVRDKLQGMGVIIAE
jgi:hypothetical protein